MGYISLGPFTTFMQFHVQLEFLLPRKKTLISKLKKTKVKFSSGIPWYPKNYHKDVPCKAWPVVTLGEETKSPSH